MNICGHMKKTLGAKLQLPIGHAVESPQYNENSVFIFYFTFLIRRHIYTSVIPSNVTKLFLNRYI